MIRSKKSLNRFRKRMARKVEQNRVQLNKEALVPSSEPKDQWTKRTRSKLILKDNDGEDSMVKLLSEQGFKVFRERAIEVGGKRYFIDFLIVSHARKKIRVAIEVDGGYHFNEEQQAKDRKKDADLMKSSRVWSILRLTAEQATKFTRAQMRQEVLSMRVGEVRILY